MDANAPKIVLLGFILACPTISSAHGNPAARAKRVAELTANLTCKCIGLAVPNECGLLSFERTEISGGVAHYKYLLRVGSGEYDVVGIHRIVKEQRPYQPKLRSDGLMMLHGDVWPFDGAFTTAVGSGVVTNEWALPVFLAKNKVDAWGMDLRWTGVPSNVPDPNAIMRD